jgi:acetyl esterase/lipase
LLLSPLTDLRFTGSTMESRRAADPMVRAGWGKQAIGWYACPAAAMDHRPLEADLRGLPPMLVQVGDDEVLLSDSTRLAEHATRCGVPCRIEVHAGRWHVFQLSSFYLGSARAAVRRLARFAQDSVAHAPAKADPVEVLEEASR